MVGSEKDQQDRSFSQAPSGAPVVRGMVLPVPMVLLSLYIEGEKRGGRYIEIPPIPPLAPPAPDMAVREDQKDHGQSPRRPGPPECP